MPKKTAPTAGTSQTFQCLTSTNIFLSVLSLRKVVVLEVLANDGKKCPVCAGRPSPSRRNFTSMCCPGHVPCIVRRITLSSRMVCPSTLPFPRVSFWTGRALSKTFWLPYSPNLSLWTMASRHIPGEGKCHRTPKQGLFEANLLTGMRRPKPGDVPADLPRGQAALGESLFHGRQVYQLCLKKTSPGYF
jgi:hypothetical protein